jgi:hypothetical protein
MVNAFTQNRVNLKKANLTSKMSPLNPALPGSAVVVDQLVSFTFLFAF